MRWRWCWRARGPRSPSRNGTVPGWPAQSRSRRGRRRHHPPGGPVVSERLAALVALDGYGLYVWGSYGLVLLALLAEALSLRARWRRARRALAEPLEEIDA
ncbi:MAG: heme exporter protein CcmD [Rubrivivax sp.]|nr:heme exporter protein CcmD [Rubrivivax sp.]